MRLEVEEGVGGPVRKGRTFLNSLGFSLLGDKEIPRKV